MEEIVDKIIIGDAQETIWLLEHNEIYTQQVHQLKIFTLKI